jgi:2-keto-4-pentenoate hydratase/2-oxohepta-3-ene-1,7-dioic acid hydratase in catechol pathway
MINNRYIIDTLGFEKHMRQLREQRGVEIPKAWYKRPYFYTLNLRNNKVKGNGEVVRFPSYVVEKDYEFEIAGVFTSPIQTSSIEVAIEYVRTKMLYTIFNDLSARDFQKDDMQMPLGISASKGIPDKSFIPQFVRAGDLDFDENGIPDIQTSLFVNGTERICQNFRDIYFDDPDTDERKCWGFAQVIAWFGKMNQGFDAGWMLGSGTIGGGSIAERANEFEWLKDGDVILMEASGIGTLENTVGVMKMPDPRLYSRL